ncbi:MAG: NAD(P)H dehydrogenase assembly family protein [Cyanobium sp.]
MATSAFNSPSDPEGDREGDWVGDPEGDQRPITPFAVGDRVHLAGALRYLKTADPMPMLRPPDLVASDEMGRVVEVRARGWFAVAFRRGTFLISGENLRSSNPGSTTAG